MPLEDIVQKSSRPLLHCEFDCLELNNKGLSYQPRLEETLIDFVRKYAHFVIVVLELSDLFEGLRDAYALLNRFLMYIP